MCSVVVVLSDFIFHLSVIMHPFTRFHVRRLRVFCSASRHSDVNAVRFRILTLSVTFATIGSATVMKGLDRRVDDDLKDEWTNG